MHDAVQLPPCLLVSAVWLHAGWMAHSGRVQEWLRVASRNRAGPKLHALREEHRRAGLPL